MTRPTTSTLRPTLAAALVIVLMAAAPAGAQQAPAPPTTGWSNTTDLSLVLTGGNSDDTTLGLTSQVKHAWDTARLEFEVSAIRSTTSDDRFFLVTPGLEFPVGATPVDPGTTLVTPEPTLDVSTSLIRGAYARDISKRFFWNAGGSWYRNEDAGIRNRYIAFAGVGNVWADSARRRLVSTYEISYTDREEDKPDPLKDRRFAGARLGWDYTEHLTKTTDFDSDFSMNVNLSDPADYSIDTLNSLTVAIARHLSLKVSVQWLFENEPALETDLDVIAYAEVVDPDGVPGTGDERFRTLASGGTKLMLGSAEARKGRLDTIIRTALVIKF